MALNRLVREQTDAKGNTIYVMLPEEIEVRATQNSGIAPSITYWVKDEDVTEDIRKLRFNFTAPGDYIQDYEEFQAKLFVKEEQAIQALYEKVSLVPKNMSTGKQILWGLFVFILISLPILIVGLLKG